MAKAFSLLVFCCAMCLFTSGGYAMQGAPMSQQCPTGGAEAEELYQLGRQYRQGHGGFPVDKAKAEKLFEQALAQGNAKAALAIGQMYMYDYSSYLPEAKREKYMIAMYEQGVKMGCPDAYVFLAECYEKGWGVRSNKKKAMELLQKSAELGSPKGMEFYGNYLITSQNQIALGRQWLQRSMDLGNGDAGLPLSDSYDTEGNIEGVILSLRAGAKLGSKACLLRLAGTYGAGYYGQDKDEAHAACYADLEDAIDDFDPPNPIPNFDKLCPLKQPFQPFK